MSYAVQRFPWFPACTYAHRLRTLASLSCEAAVGVSACLHVDVFMSSRLSACVNTPSTVCGACLPCVYVWCASVLCIYCKYTVYYVCLSVPTYYSQYVQVSSM